MTDHYIDLVTRFADDALDRLGSEQSPLLYDGLDLVSNAPLRWEQHALSNLACQQNFLRALDALSAATGEVRHRHRADEWIGHALNELRDPESDLLYWGGHSSYDLGAGAPIVGNHELKCVYPHYDYLFRTDARAMQRFVDAFWHQHIWDWSTLLFNRHGEYEDWDRARAWPADFTGGPVPMIENSALSFVNTGSDLILAAIKDYRHNGEARALDWAHRLLGRYEAIRHPETGLAGYQFNHRDPCRVRLSFKPPFDQRADVNETTVVTNNVIRTRYGRAAVTYLNIYEALGPADGRPFLDLVVRDLHAIADHALEDGGFTAVLADGTRIGPEHAIDGVGYCQPPKLERVPAEGLLFLAYARAHRLSGAERFLAVALQLARGMGWTAETGEAGRLSPPSVEAWSLADQNDASALFGLLDLHRATGDDAYQAAARSFADLLLRHYRSDTFFSADAVRADIDSALPLALLHLAAGPRAPELPVFYPNLTYFDPKIAIRRRERNA